MRPWYLTDRKFLKKKLGRLHHYNDKGQPDQLCRVMNYDRISSYQIEAFFSDLARLSLYKMSKFIVMPRGVHVSSKMEITVVLPELVSLHELIYAPERINSSSNEGGVNLRQKINLLI